MKLGEKRTKAQQRKADRAFNDMKSGADFKVLDPITREVLFDSEVDDWGKYCELINRSQRSYWQ
jgi:hypothetical protein